MNLRHEWKHEINFQDMLSLRMALSAVAETDPHTIDGKYIIRSLYFDDLYDSALRDKVNGVSWREKFRIRYYNDDTSFIQLEKKCKLGSLTGKLQAPLTADEAQRIVCGDIDWMADETDQLILQFYSKMKGSGLRAKTIVDYTREPFIYAPGNVRVTMDYNIRTGLHLTDFLNPETPTIPAGDAPIILEVKWDGFLPDVIRDAVQLRSRRVGSFSKYEQCRIYG